MNTIGRDTIDGKAANVNQAFIKTEEAPCGVAVDGSHVYWGNLATGAIGRDTIDGSSANVNQNFITGLNHPCGVAVDSLVLPSGSPQPSTAQLPVQGPTTPQPLPTTAQPPKITAASLINKRFRVGKLATAVSAKKAPLGTSFHFTLSAAAKLQIAITSTVPGQRHGHSCLGPTARLKQAHAKSCTRTVTVGTLTRASESAGMSSVAFSGRVGQKKLPPGGYSAVLSASNAGGRSAAITLPFLIVP